MKNGIHWLFSLHGKKNSLEAAQAWKNIFDLNSKDVQIILKDLFSYCHMNKSSFVAKDNNQTFFNEGARDVLLHIFEMAQLDIKEVMNVINNLE